MKKRTPPRDPGAGLDETQRLMARGVMRPLTSGERSQRAWGDGSPSAKVASSFIKPNDRLSSFERLQIYNQQYWWRILGSFQEDFRGSRAVLGERRFDRLAVAYLEAHGSTSWSLRDLGQLLPAFLEKHPALTAPHTALALDMARVEWARIVAFDGPSLPVLDPATLARKTPATIRLRLQPYLTLLALAHPVDALLRKLRQSSVETGTASNAVGANRRRRRPVVLRAKASPDPIHLAIHRVDLSVYFKRLDPEAFTLLTALNAGASLEGACASAFAKSTASAGEASGKVREWFATWTELGWLCSVRGRTGGSRIDRM